MLKLNVLIDVAEEIRVWRRYNFNIHAPTHAFAGIVEELGELTEALDPTHIDRAAVADAVADTIIYALDLCGRMNMEPPKPVPYSASVLVPLGRLAHAVLKYEQGIRGTPEEHRAAASTALSQILGFVDAVHSVWIAGDTTQTVIETWAKVKQRDFRRFPRNGLTA